MDLVVPGIGEIFGEQPAALERMRIEVILTPF
jgi:hypothetical protein